MAIHSFAGTFPFSTHRAQTFRACASPSRPGSPSIFAAMRRAIMRLRRSMPACVFTTSDSIEQMHASVSVAPDWPRSHQQRPRSSIAAGKRTLGEETHARYPCLQACDGSLAIHVGLVDGLDGQAYTLVSRRASSAVGFRTPLVCRWPRSSASSDAPKSNTTTDWTSMQPNKMHPAHLELQASSAKDPGVSHSERRRLS